MIFSEKPGPAFPDHAPTQEAVEFDAVGGLRPAAAFGRGRR